MSDKPVDPVCHLTIQRSHPVQGEDVMVRMLWNDVEVGYAEMPFTAWIKFSKLLQKGADTDVKDGRLLNVKLKIEGYVSAKHVLTQAVGLSRIDRIDDLVPEPEPETVKIGQTVRSLRPESEGDDE